MLGVCWQQAQGAELSFHKLCELSRLKYFIQYTIINNVNSIKYLKSLSFLLYILEAEGACGRDRTHPFTCFS